MQDDLQRLVRGDRSRLHGHVLGLGDRRLHGSRELERAAFASGSITYKIRNQQGKLLSTVTLNIDLGTGGVYGYPYDLSQSYWIEERTEAEPGMVLRMNGWSVNQLDSHLNPTRTFIDRQQYY
jgi:hypothetical protein